ncbi:cyclic nucleotide-binding domain-containing protein [Amphiplicatus metriothermophilus]|uniref:CRP/FNR family transcriptional regulator, transcriptional activator FtrB n=1 Tax=Amphiplicatus metriothermophilus TaxID=1519374 RepID=A0A239PQ36_9PROT|nr:cyclic nucleotide-binding domain-containing protein [Amphiplicatus metriothermophilus]MBB5518463.1 CRP/FNR family transcriptional activator FtrB [Amphiplicatus metriothermophilus]SNT72375.1 CRP/FNR family transcriptional regulator, transcriptional activator FtrB [Amphiplicatus metriothermophilus]
MRDNDKQTVRGLRLFSGMEEAHFETLLTGSYLQRFPASVILFSETDPTDFLHVLIEGQVELFASANNREGTMTLIRPVATFVLASALLDSPYHLSARTLAPSRILMIPSRNVRDAMEQDASFSQMAVLELAGCYHGVVRAYKNLKLRSAVERLANYLLVQNARQGGEGRFTIPVEKRVLASMLGMTPENLSRAFATLKPYGVRVSGADVRLDNIKDLETLAKPSRLIDLR